MFKDGFSINDLQWLMCHKTQPNQTKPIKNSIPSIHIYSLITYMILHLIFVIILFQVKLHTPRPTLHLNLRLLITRISVLIFFHCSHTISIVMSYGLQQKSIIILRLGSWIEFTTHVVIYYTDFSHTVGWDRRIRQLNHCRRVRPPPIVTPCLSLSSS